MIGKKVGRLTIKAVAGKDKWYDTLYFCDCDCGTKKHIVKSGHLKRGDIISCGCAKKTHGDSHSKLYNIFVNILYSCKRNGYLLEWLTYKDFKSWAMSIDYKDGKRLKFINDKYVYTSKNCYFEDHKYIVTINVITKCIMEWSKIYKNNYYTIKQRIKRGWNKEKAIITIPNKKNKNIKKKA